MSCRRYGALRRSLARRRPKPPLVAPLTRAFPPFAQTIGSDQVTSAIVPEIVSLSEDSQWRVRLAIIEQLPMLAKSIGASHFDSKLVPAVLVRGAPIAGRVGRRRLFLPLTPPLLRPSAR